LSALQTLISLSYDSATAKEIANNEVAKVIGPLLVDHNAIIRANVASTLKEIAKNGGEDACTNLLKDDIMTPLITLIKQVYNIDNYLYYTYIYIYIYIYIYMFQLCSCLST